MLKIFSRLMKKEKEKKPGDYIKGNDWPYRKRGEGIKKRRKVEEAKERNTVGEVVGLT